MSKDKQTATAKEEPKAMTAPDAGTKAMQAYDYGEDEGKGYENQDESHRALPFIKVLQALNPEISNPNKKVPGAEVGMFFNTATAELYKGDPGIYIVPAITDRVYLEFKPRKLGGGFEGRHLPTDDIVLAAIARNKEKGWDFGEYWTGDRETSHELTETFQIYAILCDPTDLEVPQTPVLIGLQSKKIKPYKNWNTRIGQFTIQVPGSDGKMRKRIPPLYAHWTQCKTIWDKNDQGEFYNIVIQPAVKNDLGPSLLSPTDPRFLAAKNLWEMTMAGETKVDYKKMDNEGGGGAAKKAEGASAF